MNDRDAAGSGGRDGGGRDRLGRLRWLLDRAVLVGIVLFGFVAAVQFYLAAGDVVRTWVDPAYRSAVRALFNLALLSLAGAAASYQLRRLAGDGDGDGDRNGNGNGGADG